VFPSIASRFLAIRVSPIFRGDSRFPAPRSIARTREVRALIKSRDERKGNAGEPRDPNCVHCLVHRLLASRASLCVIEREEKSEREKRQQRQQQQQQQQQQRTVNDSAAWERGGGSEGRDSRQACVSLTESRVLLRVRSCKFSSRKKRGRRRRRDRPCGRCRSTESEPVSLRFRMRTCSEKSTGSVHARRPQTNFRPVSPLVSFPRLHHLHQRICLSSIKRRA